MDTANYIYIIALEKNDTVYVPAWSVDVTSDRGIFCRTVRDEEGVEPF